MDEIDEKVVKTEGEPEKGSLFSRLKEKRQKKQEEKIEEFKKEDDEKDKKGRFLRHEFSYSQFQQTLILPDNVDTDAIEAKQCNGVLTVMIPKKQAPAVSEKKKIAVK